MENVTLNGINVKRVKDAIFIPLPRALWTGGGGCSCGKCDGSGYWDTLAVSRVADKHDWTWTVHYPELNHAEYREMKKSAGGAR